MSSRFWIIGGGVLLASIAVGYGLGGFAGGRFGGGVWQDLKGYENVQSNTGIEEITQSDPYLSNVNPADGGDVPLTPDQIVCKGCGPTLAERNMMGDAYAIGEDDPALRTYEAQGDAAHRSVATPPPAVAATIQKPVSSTSDATGLVEPARSAQQ
jgi:hypothetical protein